MNCWFEASTTDSFDVTQSRRCTTASASCPAARARTTTARSSGGRCTAAGGQGGFPPGYAADDAAALVFEGTTWREIVTTEEGSTAYRVDAGGEKALAARLL